MLAITDSNNNPLEFGVQYFNKGHSCGQQLLRYLLHLAIFLLLSCSKSRVLFFSSALRSQNESGLLSSQLFLFDQHCHTESWLLLQYCLSEVNQNGAFKKGRFDSKGGRSGEFRFRCGSCSQLKDCFLMGVVLGDTPTIHFNFDTYDMAIV